MPNLTNPEAFQLEAAAILAAGYAAFPCEFAWSYDADTECYPTDTGKSRAEIQFHTIRWLKDQGYLYGGGLYGDRWEDLRLTDRALGCLDVVPDILSGKEPIGKRLVAAVGSGSIEIIKQLIPILFRQATGP